jgi:hypothetical protein
VRYTYNEFDNNSALDFSLDKRLVSIKDIIEAIFSNLSY